MSLTKTAKGTKLQSSDNSPKFKTKSEYIEFCKTFTDDFLKNNRVLLHYMKKNGQRVGVVVLYRKDNKDIYFGWSKCNTRDVFNKYVGFYHAVSRSKSWNKFKYLPRKDKVGRFYMVDTTDDTFMVTKACHSPTVDALRRAQKFFKTNWKGGTLPPFPERDVKSGTD